jgi:hypothetical protein
MLIGSAVLAAAGGTWLSVSFGWPDVLDLGGAQALPRFALDEAAVRAAFLLMLVSSLLLIPAAIFLEQVVGGPARASVRTVTTFGVIGAFAQILGWVRWPVTVPHLSDAYAAGTAGGREAVAASYDTLNRYAGGALGENLGWLFQGLWALGLAVLLLRLTDLPRWIGVLGLGLAAAWWPLLTASGLVDVEWLAPVGSMISVLWYLWLLGLGVLLLVRPVRTTR